MYRTLRQVDSVKLVVVDLDDTLWRGVLAEENDISPDRIEGWPLGLVEALLYLRRRGVLLAILSKNDEARATKLFEDIYGRYMPLEAFTIRKINWKPKSENMQEILKEANLLPRNVVFIDDNPVERAAVRAAFPDLRVLGDNPLLCRRILLHSPETQVAKITEESSRRGEMVKAQIVREESRAKMSREDFIESLNVEVTIEAIDRLDHPRFARAFELINKTNQFNTTGRRWREGEIQALLQGGGALDVFQVLRPLHGLRACRRGDPRWIAVRAVRDELPGHRPRCRDGSDRKASRADAGGDGRGAFRRHRRQRGRLEPVEPDRLHRGRAGATGSGAPPRAIKARIRRWSRRSRAGGTLCFFAGRGGRRGACTRSTDTPRPSSTSLKASRSAARSPRPAAARFRSSPATGDGSCPSPVTITSACRAIRRWRRRRSRRSSATASAPEPRGSSLATIRSTARWRTGLPR